MGTQTECSQKCSSEADHNVAQLGASEQDAPRFRVTLYTSHINNMKLITNYSFFSALASSESLPSSVCSSAAFSSNIFR